MKQVDYIRKWDKGEDNEPENKRRISIFWSLLYLILAISLYFLFFLNWEALPNALTVQDETKNQHRFNGGVAKKYLKDITDIGPRVGGSFENEVLTVQLLQKILSNTIFEANPAHRIELEVQKGYGNVTLIRDSYPTTCVFRGIQNVVVKMTPSNSLNDPDHYILLNSHFDTVPQSPGAGDDASMVSVMLEVFRKMTRNDKTFKHGIVFLFNGFEENRLQGSYAFISGHRWFQKVRLVINLDSTSTGGKDIMFQNGPDFPFLMKYYSRYISSPVSTSIGEQLFQSGFIPSATDFQQWVSYGKIAGYDIAYNRWGYFYHTKYDDYDAVPAESLQYTGDNVMSLTEALADAEEVDDLEAHRGGHSIFFDFLNWFMVAYTETIGSIIHSFIIIFAVSMLSISIVQICDRESVGYTTVLTEFAITLVIQIMSIVIGALFCVLLAVILDAVGRSMSWFTNVWLLFGLYYLPFLILLCLGPLLYIKFRKLKYFDVQTRICMFLHAQHLTHILLLIIFTSMEWQSSYIFSMTTFTYSFTNLINILLRFKKYHWIYVHMIGQVAPFLYYSSITMSLFATIVPMTARGNSLSNPDLTIVVLAIGSAFLMFGFKASLVSLLRRPFFFLGLLTLYFIINMILVATPIGFPFREAISPQRYYLYHMERNFYDINGDVRKSDSKIFMHPQDRHTPYTILDVIPEMENAELLGDECDKELYCGIPYYVNRNHKQSSIIYWLPFSKPDFPTPQVQFSFEGKQEVLNGTKFNFKIKGIDHMGFYISPFEGCRLSQWSFTPEIPRSGPKWNGQDVFYVNYVYGIDDSESSFFIEIEHPTNRPPNTPSFYLTIVGQYMHHESYRTEDYKSFISKFPSFTNVVAYISHYENRLF